jgi:RHS repeat-associated protein
LTGASDPYSSYTYTYDKAGRETSVSNAGTPGVPTVTLSFGYDAFGNRTSLSDSLGGSISYAFDAANRLTSLAMTVNGSTAAQVTLGYDAANRLTGLTRTAPSVSGDTITTSYSYDNANRLTNITHTDVSKTLTLSSYTYGYDKASELTSYQDNSGNSLTYGYDVNGELTGATGTLAGSNYTFTYNYNHNGNRTSTSTVVNGTLTSATYTTGSDNELTSDGTYTYTYDADGNMTSQTNIHTGSVTYYTWDYRNRLTEVKQGNSDEKFTYDVNNSRIAISLNGTTQLYTVYDGANPYMDFNGSGQLTERYLTNPNGLNQFYGQVSASGTTQWFLTDNINSIRQVVSTSGSSLDTITYDPYGTILNQTNSANAPRFGFASGAVDSITGNDQFDERYYNPSAGRFLNQDPLGFGGEDTNLYRYTFNAPTQYSDPSGEGINFGFALGGFVIGALVGGGMALLQGQGIGGVLAGAGKGALVGGIAGLTFGASLAVGAAATSAAGITGGFAATAAGVTTNAVAEIVSGQVGHATANLLNGESVTSGLGQPGEMATDAALGVVAPPVLRGVRWIGGRFWRFLRRGASSTGTVPEFGPNTLGAAQAPRYIPGYGWTDRAYWKLVKLLPAGKSVEAPTLRVAAELRRDAFPELTRSCYRGPLSEAPRLRGTYDWHNPRKMIHPGPHQTPHLQMWLEDGTTVRIEVPE